MTNGRRSSERPNRSVSLLSRVVKFFRTGLAEGILILILLAFFVILSFTSPSFLTLNNLSNLVRQVAIIGVVAIGMTIVIISAGIDLSVGSVVGFSNVLVAVLMTHAVPIIPSILIALAAGAALGAGCCPIAGWRPAGGGLERRFVPVRPLGGDAQRGCRTCR